MIHRAQQVVSVVIIVILMMTLCPFPLDSAPTYRVEPCCDLCPKASLPASYDTPSLKPFRVLVQGKDGWLFRSEGDLQETFRPDPLEYQNLHRFQKGLNARGIDVVIVYLPTRGLVHADKVPLSSWPEKERKQAWINYKGALEQFRRMGMIVPAMEDWMDAKNGSEDFFRRDTDLTSSGAKRTAQQVADAIARLPAYKTIPKKKFITTRVGVIAKTGSLQKTATLLCKFGYPNQYVDRFETLSDTRDIAAGNGMPHVALLGGSRSDRRANFAGFLSEFLRVDILDLNDSGKTGYNPHPLLAYLSGRMFQTSPPKILILEVEADYDSILRPEFHSSILWIRNGCRGKAPALNKQTDLTPPSKVHEVLFNQRGGKMLPLLGKDHQVDIQFSDPSIRQIQAVVWYTDGSKRILTHQYPDNANTYGRFIFGLDHQQHQVNRAFLSLDISVLTPVDGPVSVTAQLCAEDKA